MPGDHIGVFYTNDSGELACGGATPWLGDENTGIIAFGNDAFTAEKDGFASGETITYKFYSWALHQEYFADAICNDALPVQCDVFVSNGLSGVDSIWANAFYFVGNASHDTLCQGDQVQFFVEASGGNGSYTYNWTSDPPGFNATIPNPVHVPAASTTYYVTVTSNGQSLGMQFYVQTFSPPFADAGANDAVCADESLSLEGQHADDSGFFWSSAGDGTFDNDTLINPEYFPGTLDISSGLVQLSLTANPVQPCDSPLTSTMQLIIESYPEVFAGDDRAACEDDSPLLIATVSNTTQMLWTTSGDGTFSAPLFSTSVYYPGSNDLQIGNVELSITGIALSPCQGQFSDALQLSFQELPLIDAGVNQLVCEDATVQLSASTQNTASVLWQTSGDGTFADPALIETTYYPGSLDIADGEVDLAIVGQPVSPCSSAFSDALQILINGNPMVAAGEDATICQNTNMQLAGSAMYYDEVLWTSTGDGDFDNPDQLSTTYTPGTNDIANGLLTISLTAIPVFPCTVQGEDDLILSIEYLPTAIAGEDATIHYTENYQLLGDALNYSILVWSSSGDGFFNAWDILDPVYTLGSQDIANAGVQLALTAFPISACQVGASDSLYLTIDTITGIQTLHTAWQPNIYPNPAKAHLFVELPSESCNHGQIFIYDNFGRKIYEWNMGHSDTKIPERLQIDMAAFEPGLYFLEMRIDDTIFYKKIVKALH